MSDELERLRAENKMLRQANEEAQKRWNKAMDVAEECWEMAWEQTELDREEFDRLQEDKIERLENTERKLDSFSDFFGRVKKYPENDNKKGS